MGSVLSKTPFNEWLAEETVVVLPATVVMLLKVVGELPLIVCVVPLKIIVPPLCVKLPLFTQLFFVTILPLLAITYPPAGIINPCAVVYNDCDNKKKSVTM